MWSAATVYLDYDTASRGYQSLTPVQLSQQMSAGTVWRRQGLQSA